MRKQISLRNKITIAFTLLILIGGLIWGISDYRNFLLNKRLNVIEDKSKLLNTILEARRYEKNSFLYLDESNLKQALNYIKDAESHMAEIIQAHGEYTVSRNLDETFTKLKQYKALIITLIELHSHKKSAVIDMRLKGDYEKIQNKIRGLGQEITTDVEYMMQQERLHLNTIIKQSRFYLFSLSLAVFLVSIGVAIFLVFNVNRPLKAIEHAIQKIIQGDYTNIVLNNKSIEFVSLVDSMNNMIFELNRRNEQLIQTEKMASLGILTSGVAHELNNPLNNISTSIQIVLEELEDGNIEQKRELLSEAEQQVDRARDIVKALLEFSKKTSYNPKATPLKSLIKKAIRLINAEVPANVKIFVDVPSRLIIVLDPRRIQQVFINLILNGVQVMESAGNLTILARHDEAKQEVIIEVRDTGKGIPEEQLKKIFDPFYTTKDAGKGSGLGLSVSHGIIEQHGGRITVKSKPGQGTSFFVMLPEKAPVPKRGEK